MPSKRRRDTEQIFDPNESDPDDENFEPGDDRPSRPKKRSRSNKSAKSGKKRRGAYGGSDIDDDEDVSDSNEDVSFDDDDGDDNEDEEEEDAPVNAAGRRTRKAAAKPVKYEESDEEEEDNFDDDDDDSDDAPTNKKNRKSGKSRQRGASNRLVSEELEDPVEPPRQTSPQKIVKLKIKTAGALKAFEIVTNVDVDVAGVIQQTAHIDWDALKHRQIERAKLAADKERKRRAMQSIVDRVQSDAAAGNDSDSQGPVVLGEPIPGSRHTTTRFQPMSPLRTADAIGSDSHSHSNGNTKPSRLSDVQMGGVNDDTQPIYEPHVMKPPAPEWLRTDHITTTSSAMATAGNTQLSQRSAVTTVPPGVSPSALLNDASTTKTSDPSDRSSSKWSTQHTNGYHADHNARMDDSQLPDTQIPPGGGGSQLGDDQWQHSQLDALHRPSDGPATQPSQVNSTPSAAQKSQAISLGNILNDSPTNDHIRNSGSSSSQQQVVIHESRVEALHDELTSRTSGCTIEQLEQINRELMDEVWKTRGDWNRMTVLGCITRVFNDTIKDIEDIQGLLQQSQE
ncbi:hypothetical protein BN1723_000501, partial [Verticillium longisporum]